MSKLFEAALTGNSTTENGAATNLSSLDANLDFFFLAGASRGKDISTQFAKSVASNKDVAVRTLFWLRDIRGGSGERAQFKALIPTLFSFLSKEEVASVISKVPEVGRYDDLEVFFGTPFEVVAASVWNKAISEGNALAAKWAPVKDAKGAKPLRKAVGMNEHQWRKHVVSKRTTVEQQMCSNKWEDVVFNHVPSVAAARYQKAFTKHQPERYEAYKQALAEGKAKVNAAAIYPYDVVKSMLNGDADVANAQWQELPNYLEGNTENILAVVDVSGSMRTPLGADYKATVTCKDVAISLGMYIAERSNGIFKDHFISFSGRPNFHQISGNLEQRYMQMDRSGEDMNTNILGVFERILNAGISNNLNQEDMPTKVIIFSDMEFDACPDWTVYVRRQDKNTVFEHIRRVYKECGYEMPQLVFWNLNARAGNFPVKRDDSGVAMVSGFSPSIMKALLGGKDFNPLQIMLDTVMVERYNWM